MTYPLVILGTGGNAYDVLDIVDAINAQARTWEVVGFLDDARPAGSKYLGLKVLGPLRSAVRYDGMTFINAIGSDRSFRRRPQLLAELGLSAQRFATLIHPTASVSPRARLGRDVCVNHGVSVAGGVTIGDHVSLGPGCIVGHDTTIEAHTMLAPGAVVSGFVHIGPTCYIGAGAILRQKVEIGTEALIGMGAIVLRDVEAGTTVVGNPARVLERASMSGTGVEN